MSRRHWGIKRKSNLLTDRLDKRTIKMLECIKLIAAYSDSLMFKRLISQELRNVK